MTLSSTISLFVAMVVLAAIPSLSVLTVTTRSATHGLIHGVFTAIGIVAGDIFLIVMAIWGLSIVETALGGFALLFKCLGGLYLIYLGIQLCRSKSKNVEVTTVPKSSLLSSFSTGLIITLADQKAALFYIGFLPAFLDISQTSVTDLSIIILTTILAVGGTKLVYVFLADRTRTLWKPQRQHRLNLVAGCVMIAVGVFIIVKNVGLG